MLPYNTGKRSGFQLAVHKFSFYVSPTHVYNFPVLIERCLLQILLTKWALFGGGDKLIKLLLQTSGCSLANFLGWENRNFEYAMLDNRIT